ncbi:hypothetical protein LtaPh_3126400 [Leishmania tarentolae]|uniref:Uncharacterized protein n=1 Tax=Leishmania tarentolae TaxID=5689 RepID=A0A640KNE2_LEITA|nr:hypothetical protein LtaPh_3126400 [Leishmania tarentolae]
MGCGLSLPTSSTAQETQMRLVSARPTAAHRSSRHDQTTCQLSNCNDLLRAATAQLSSITSCAASREGDRSAWSNSSSANNSLLNLHSVSYYPPPYTFLYTEESPAGAEAETNMQHGAPREGITVDGLNTIRQQLSMENWSWANDLMVDSPLHKEVSNTKKEETFLLLSRGNTSTAPLCASGGAAPTQRPRSASCASTIIARVAAEKGARTCVCVKQSIPRATPSIIVVPTKDAMVQVPAPSAEPMPGGDSRSESSTVPERSWSPVVDTFDDECASCRSTDSAQGWKSEALSSRPSQSASGTAAHPTECITGKSFADEYDLSAIMHAAEAPWVPTSPLSGHSKQSPKVKRVLSAPHVSFVKTVSDSSTPLALRRTSPPPGGSLSSATSAELSATARLGQVYHQSKEPIDSRSGNFSCDPPSGLPSGDAFPVGSEVSAARIQHPYSSGENVYSFYAICSNSLDPFIEVEEDMVRSSADGDNSSPLYNTPQVSCASHNGGHGKAHHTVKKYEETRNADPIGGGDDEYKGPGTPSHTASANVGMGSGHTTPVMRASSVERKERRRTVKIVDYVASPALADKTPARPILMN